MSNKFSILITVDAKGNITSKAWEKKDSQVGVSEFVKSRENGKEAYFFQHPTPDSRCKSSVDTSNLKSMISDTTITIKGKPQADIQVIEEVKQVKQSKQVKQVSSLDGAVDLE
jgi:hypothetical protein